MSSAASLRASDLSGLGEGRLGNVAAAVLAAAGARAGGVRALAELLGHLCEEVRVVGTPETSSCFLELLVEALAIGDSAQLLVVDASGIAPSPELLLALTAFPEAEVVMPEGPRVSCALYRREAVLPPARTRLAAGDRDATKLHALLTVSRIAGADLDAVSGAF